MKKALAQWDVKMAMLDAEEMELRRRIRMIEGQKDAENGERELRGGGGEKDGGDIEQGQKDEDGTSEDEYEDAVSEPDADEYEDAVSEPAADEAEQKMLPPPQNPNPHQQTGPRYLHLPDELILQITSYVSRGACSQQALATCCRLSRQWYDAAIPLLYRQPKLDGRNFDPFVRAVCPSINLHVRKSPLAELVRVLDMSQLVHQASKSVTARLLGRTKERLEEFVAPQASFSLHSFPALAKCGRLKVLDLSLVSEAPPLPDLFKSISHLTTLNTLRLPRSTGFGVHHKKSSFTSCWPPNLTNLTLSGGIDAHFLHGIASFPQTLTHLAIEHCPLAKTHAITHLLKTAVRPLKKLESVKIAHMPRLSDHALNAILFILPQITHLSVSVDYITMAIFDEGHFNHSHSKDSSSNSPTLSHPNLRTFELTNSGASDAREKIDPFDLMMAIESGDTRDSRDSRDGRDGTLPNLRQVRVAQSLGWHLAGSADDTEELTDALQEGARADWEKREWVFEGMAEEEYWREKVWERWSGVWVFEG